VFWALGSDRKLYEVGDNSILKMNEASEFIYGEHVILVYFCICILHVNAKNEDETKFEKVNLLKC
jgi:hypothetical protein